MSRRLWTSLAVVATLAGPAAAQQPQYLRQIVMPDGGSLPTQFVLDKANQPWKVWVAAEGDAYLPRATVGESAPLLLGGRVLKFMEPCFFVYEYADPKGRDSYLLLAKADGPRFGSHVGWMNKDLVVMGTQARKNLKTRNYEKALIVHTVEELKRRGGKAPDDVPALSAPGPGPNVQELAKFDLQNILFAYARNRTHVLIGSAQSFVDGGEAERAPTKVVQGWVPLDRVIQWDNREGILWNREATLRGANPRREPDGKVYLNAESAHQGLRGRGVETLYDEETETYDGVKVSLEWPKDRPRPPKLEWRSTPGVTTVDPRTRNRLLRVGWIGNIISEVNPHRMISQDELLRRNRVLERYRQQIRVKELLFVIDDTLSMKKWFRTVAGTVERIVNSELAAAARRRIDDGDGQSHPEVRLAIAYYADVGQPVVTQRLTGVIDEIRRRIAELADHAPREGGPGTRGMLFEGLRIGIKAADFSQVATKVVFVIGDMGDRSDPVEPAHPEEESIVALLMDQTPKNSPIEFCAIHMQDPDSHEDAGVFRTQMETVNRLLSLRGRAFEESGQVLGSYLPPPARQPGEDDQAYDDRVASAAQARLDQRYEQVLLYMNQQRQATLERQQGKRGNSRAGPVLLALLGNADFEGKQVCQEGYVWVESSAPGRPRQVRSQFMLAHADIERIIEVVDAFLARNPEDPSTDLRGVAQDLLLRFKGEKDEGKSLNFVLESEGLEFKSPLLTKAINQIDSPLARQELPKIRHRLARLMDVRDHKERPWRRALKRDESGEEIEHYEAAGEPHELDRSFRIPGNGVRWYYVDEEELP
jgi:hypothetical protein